MHSLATETAFPFEDIMYFSQCPTASAPLMYPFGMNELPTRPTDWPAPPSRVEPDTLNPDTLSICYILLIHDHAQQAMRLVDALMEPQHTFAIHVDLKAQAVYEALQVYAGRQTYRNVFLVDPGRIAANWGGYSIVNATFAGMAVAWSTGRYFDFMMDLSGATYPLRSNRIIRETLALRGANAVYMLAATTPTATGTSPDFWNHFVECDDRLHRIARYSYPRGINLFTGSQVPYTIPLLCILVVTSVTESLL